MAKVLLNSGGMDSMLLAHEPELQGALHLFVDVGQTYVDKERVASMEIAVSANARWEEIKTANLSAFEHPSGIIPFRNAEMILCAAQYGTEIYLGVIADEINSDKSVEFCYAMRNVLNISHRKQYWTEGKHFEVLTPYRLLSKTELVQRYLWKGNNLCNLLKSVSCYDAGDKHCGRCASCFKRWVALVNALQYQDWAMWGFAKNPAEWKTYEQWEEIAVDYSFNRTKEILGALHIALAL